MITEIKNQNLLEQSTIAAIKRKDDDFGIGGSLDGLFGYTASDVETTSTIEVVGNHENIGLALKEYEQFSYDHFLPFFTLKPIKKYSNLVLTPAEMSVFINEIEKFQKEENYSLSANLFVNRLIQNSYDAGNNDFNLYVEDLPNASILKKLKATEDNPLKIRLNGSVGDFVARESNYLDLTIDGRVGDYFADNSNNLIASITGDVGKHFGSNSHNIKTKINGNVGYSFGFQSFDIDAEIIGMVGHHFGYNSNNLKANIVGFVDFKFGSYSRNLSCNIDGNCGKYFGDKSIDLKAYVDGQVISISKTAHGLKINPKARFFSKTKFLKEMKEKWDKLKIKD
jgi:hypothetical protein